MTEFGRVYKASVVLEQIALEAAICWSSGRGLTLRLQIVYSGVCNFACSPGAVEACGGGVSGCLNCLFSPRKRYNSRSRRLQRLRSSIE